MKVNVADFANLTLLPTPAALKAKLARAVLVPTDEVPEDVVTMRSRVVVCDTSTGMRREVVIVYPAEANTAAGRVSVLDPLGAALFGASAGDAIEFASGNEEPCRLRVEEILFQPEHWMRLNLVVRE